MQKPLLIFVCAMAAAMLAFVPSASASRDGVFISTGNDLYAYCQRASDPFCAGYITGFVDASATICLPKEATAGQVRDVVVKFLVDHPERRHELTFYLIHDAMYAAFGVCKKGK